MSAPYVLPPRPETDDGDSLRVRLFKAVKAHPAVQVQGPVEVESGVPVPRGSLTIVISRTPEYDTLYKTLDVPDAPVLRVRPGFENQAGNRKRGAAKEAAKEDAAAPEAAGAKKKRRRGKKGAAAGEGGAAAPAAAAQPQAAQKKDADEAGDAKGDRKQRGRRNRRGKGKKEGAEGDAGAAAAPAGAAAATTADAAPASAVAGEGKKRRARKGKATFAEGTEGGAGEAGTVGTASPAGGAAGPDGAADGKKKKKRRSRDRRRRKSKGSSSDESDVDPGSPIPPPAAFLARRKTVTSHVISNEEALNFSPVAVPKDTEATLRLTRALDEHRLFSHLEEDEIATLVQAFSKAPTDAVLKAGTPDPYLYCLTKGSVTITQPGRDSKTHTVGEASGVSAGADGARPAGEVAGFIFNEVGAMQLGLRTEHAEFSPDAEAWRLEHDTYSRIRTKSSYLKRKRYCGYVDSVSWLKGALSHPQKLDLADSLRTATFKDGETVIAYGEVVRHMYFIVEGEIKVIGRTDSGEKKEVCTFERGRVIGELEFLHGHKAVADCVAHGQTRTARIGRHHFELTCGPLKEFLAHQAQDDPVYAYYRGRQEFAKKQEEKKGGKKEKK